VSADSRTANAGQDRSAGSFSVRLDNFEGPFDLLLQLIAKHQLDITEVALSKVTDEFISSVKSLGGDWDLDATSNFLVVAATLLDLKIVRLLPSARLEDDDDLALLEARDLLFARLMQYRAFKHVADLLQRRMAEESRRFPRRVGLEDRFTAMLPEVVIPVDLDAFAALAAGVLRPPSHPVMSLDHLHASTVSVRDQAAGLVDRLRRTRVATFRSLASDSPDDLTTVARFLALLELFREGAVAFDQLSALGELSIRWTGSDEGDVLVGDEYDEVSADSDSDSAPADSVTDADVQALAGERV
jgi:segregation and condensation protein A